MVGAFFESAQVIARLHLTSALARAFASAFSWLRLAGGLVGRARLSVVCLLSVCLLSAVSRLSVASLALSFAWAPSLFVVVFLAVSADGERFCIVLQVLIPRHDTFNFNVARHDRLSSWCEEMLQKPKRRQSDSGLTA